MDIPFSDTDFPTTGQEVEPGIYACIVCPHETENDKAVIILDKRSKLPICPVCGNLTGWMKI